jgi:hypothetical protein
MGTTMTSTKCTALKLIGPNCKSYLNTAIVKQKLNIYNSLSKYSTPTSNAGLNIKSTSVTVKTDAILSNYTNITTSIACVSFYNNVFD